MILEGSCRPQMIRPLHPDKIVVSNIWDKLLLASNEQIAFIVPCGLTIMDKAFTNTNVITHRAVNKLLKLIT